MPGYLDPISNLTWGYNDGEDGWGGATNRSLRQLAYFGLHPSVKNTTTSTPPAGPAEGDKYIVAANPTGAWSTYTANDLAVWGRSLSAPATLAWQRFIPRKGVVLYDEATDNQLKYNGTAWETSGGSDVQSDWNQTDNTQPDYIKNKPLPIYGDNTFNFTETANLNHNYNFPLLTLTPAQQAALMIGDNFVAAVRMIYTGGASTTNTQLNITLNYSDTSIRGAVATSASERVSRFIAPGRLLRTSGVSITPTSNRLPVSVSIQLRTTATSSDTFTCTGTLYYGVWY